MPAPAIRPPPPGRRPESPSSPRTKTAPSRSQTARLSSSLNPSTTAGSSSPRRPARASVDSKDISEQLKHATEQKEALLVKIQEKDQLMGSLTSENANLTSSLHAAETRLNELYADQSRSEMELAQRFDIADKLRQQVKDLEREKRDLQRRYNEQTTTFDAERQAFYDSEQHLKSRIQSLAQSRKQTQDTITIEMAPTMAPTSSMPGETDHIPPVDPPFLEASAQKMDDPDTEPAEMTALKLELSTLSTSYSSMQSTLVLLQSQLVDLKRVNNQLQEENESYLILLREKTLSGQYDPLKVTAGDSDEVDSDDEYAASNGDGRSLQSTGRRSILDRVDEEEVQGTLGDELARSMDSDLFDTQPARGPSRRRAASSASRGSAPRGESLANLPITGPGLDLAAELGRAENKDILEGNLPVEDRDRSAPDGKASKSSNKMSGGSLVPSGAPSSEVEALKTEVKSLKDANRALSLYASKIIDRIIAQEGFENVLAVDYDTEPSTPATAAPPKPKTPKTPPTNKPRPQSVFLGKTTSQPAPPTPTRSMSTIPPKQDAPPPPSMKAQRRSLSFDWRNFSLFSGSDKKPDTSLKPLTLKPGANSVTTARKLETQEDDEDRKERDRLNATMKLMGIQPSAAPPPASSMPPPSTSIVTVPPTPSQATSNNANRRFSLFGRGTAPEPPPAPPADLTHDALQHAEVENSLAALDSLERSLSAEISKGSGSGFTELQRKPGGRRSRRSAGGSGSNSGSTVWSIGHEDDD